MSGGRLRAAWGAGFFAWSLLAVLRAPTYWLWPLAIAATEWGHFLGAAALLAWAPGWSRTRAGRWGAALAAAAALAFFTPLARAYGSASAVDAALAAAFGASAPRSSADAPARPAPLVASDLWLGVASPAVEETERVYARDCGGSLSLQLYRPRVRAGRLPLVLVVHGGSWRSGSRFEMPQLSRYLAARGYAVASVDYALAPGATFPGPVQDLRDALADLRRGAAELSIDPDRVVLLGRSAGAQIALAAAAADERLPGVRGVISFYGPNDLRLAWAVPGDPRIIDSRLLLREYLGGSPAEFPERYDSASALLRAGKDFPPTLMIHGDRDELVWPLHERRLSARLAALGVPHAFVELPWATHGCDYAFSGPCGQVSTYAVERFLSAVTR